MDGDDRTLHRFREGALAGRPGAGACRPVIAASWRRLRSRGLDPGAPPAVAPLDDAALERRRAASGLAPMVPRLRAALAPLLEEGDRMMVVADSEGRVLWRHGGAGVRRRADRLGFVGGSAWTEGNVGTNAIGTCLVLGAPVRVRGPEHYADSHVRWGCAAAPVCDPWTGRTLGVVDVSGPPRSISADAAALVELAARVAALEVRQERTARLERLRAHAAPLVARVGGRAAVVDSDGRLAAVAGMTAPDSVALPRGMDVGEVWLPRLGRATAEALAGGWLLRFDPPADGDRPTALVLDLAAGEPRLTVRGPSGTWAQTLSPRHAEIMVSLVRHREGRSAAELAADLYADAGRVVTVRAEVSRLRRILGPVLRHRPYRIASSVAAELRLPGDRSRVLPASSAPVVAPLRTPPTAPPG